MVFDPPASGLLCPILRTSNSGSTTTRGFAPIAVPVSTIAPIPVPASGASIATCAMEPRTVLLPSLIDAATLTVGGVYSAAACLRTNVTVQGVLYAVPLLAGAVSISFPSDFVQTPEVPNKPDVDPSVDVTVRVVSSVCVPVNPVIVTIEPAGKLLLAVSVTVIVTSAPANGVLCPMALVLNDCSITFIGFPPFVTPYTFAVSVVMTPREVGNAAVPEAAMVTVASFCAVDGFVIVHENEYVVPAATIWFVNTVSVRMVPSLLITPFA